MYLSCRFDLRVVIHSGYGCPNVHNIMTWLWIYNVFLFQVFKAMYINNMIRSLQLKHKLNLCVFYISWWRHQMEIFSALLAICAGNSLVTGEFPSQSPVTQSFNVFFDLCLNKRLNKQWWGWWFETPSHLLWRHNNAEWRHYHHAPIILPLPCVNTSVGYHWVSKCIVKYSPCLTTNVVLFFYCFGETFSQDTVHNNRNGTTNLDKCTCRQTLSNR